MEEVEIAVETVGELKETCFILDHGYVRWVDHMGTDLSVVNAARVSFMKESREMDAEMNDSGLLRFLWREREMSPFRHAVMTFEVYAPLMVARQWWKYVVGSDHDPMLAWNESSRRYVTEEPEFYVPEFREAPSKDRKQGSGELLPLGARVFWKMELENVQRQALALYNRAIELGVAPEQARLYLPAYGLYVRWRWTCSLQGCLHFLQQRLEDKAQFEIREYASAVRALARQHFPFIVGEAFPADAETS
jgi:thymidylate synthase (FAD)